MNYTINGIPVASDELYHHGILGQKWGKRNGPPYPLDASDHSAAEKRAANREARKSEREARSAEKKQKQEEKAAAKVQKKDDKAAKSVEKKVERGRNTSFVKASAKGFLIDAGLGVGYLGMTLAGAAFCLPELAIAAPFVMGTGVVMNRVGRGIDLVDRIIYLNRVQGSQTLKTQNSDSK